jgi:hypothetical protein
MTYPRSKFFSIFRISFNSPGSGSLGSVGGIQSIECGGTDKCEAKNYPYNTQFMRRPDIRTLLNLTGAREKNY